MSIILYINIFHLKRKTAFWKLSLLYMYVCMVTYIQYINRIMEDYRYAGNWCILYLILYLRRSPEVMYFPWRKSCVNITIIGVLNFCSNLDLHKRRFYFLKHTTYSFGTSKENKHVTPSVVQFSSANLRAI